MAISIIPPMKRIPEGATEETRVFMFLEYTEFLAALNRAKYLPFGVERRWWQFWVLEHPWTKYVNDPLVGPYISKYIQHRKGKSCSVT